VTFQPDEYGKRDRWSSKGKRKEKRERENVDLDGIFMFVHLYGTEVWTHELYRFRYAERSSRLKTRCELRDEARRAKRRKRKSERFPRVYSRQFGERNRKRALSRERDSSFKQIKVRKEEEREKQRKGSEPSLVSEIRRAANSPRAIFWQAISSFSTTTPTTTTTTKKKRRRRRDRT